MAEREEEKVKIHFQAVGSAPMMRKTKFVIKGSEPFSTLETFLARELKLPKHERFFLYCDSAFAPNPQENLSDLFACFAGKRGELIVNYATTPAYG
mmetsp:Transcript_13280/g.17736  ORF Transcript_13280/g.17736 Transcript_13280/m.17736 type:complete len:96 (-) Transcript_13280:31-318(-)